MKSRMLAGTAAILLAVIGSILLATYTQSADTRAQQGLDPSNVLVVQERIPAGTPVEDLESFVQLQSIPSSAIATKAIGDLTDQSGKVTGVDLEPGEQLLSSRLVNPAELTTPGTVPVPEGLQEVTIQLEPQRIVGGKISAGDTVGFFVSFVDVTSKDDSRASETPIESEEGSTTKMVFHKVLVTGMQRAETAVEGDESATALPSGAMLVTLACNDVDAAKIVFSAEYGTIWLTKEPAEAGESAPIVINKSEVYR